MSFMRCELLGRHLRHALLQLVEHRVEELLLQLLHQLFELLARRVVHPVVLLELADAARRDRAAAARAARAVAARALRAAPRAACRPTAARRRARRSMPARSSSTISSSRFGDVLVHAAEVVAVELLAALLAQLLEHLAHALDVATLRGPGIPAASCGAARRSDRRGTGDRRSSPRAARRRRDRTRPACRPSGSTGSTASTCRYRTPVTISASDFWWGTARVLDAGRGRGARIRLVRARNAPGRVPPSGDGQRLRRRATPRTSSCTRSTGSPTTGSRSSGRASSPRRAGATTRAIEHYREVLTAARDGGHLAVGLPAPLHAAGLVHRDRRRRLRRRPRPLLLLGPPRRVLRGDVRRPRLRLEADQRTRRVRRRSTARADVDAQFDEVLGARGVLLAQRDAWRELRGGGQAGRDDPQPVAGLHRRRDGAGRQDRGRTRRDDLGRVDARRPRRRARAARDARRARSPTCAKRATSSASRTTRATGVDARGQDRRRTRPARASGRWATRRGAKGSASCCTGCTTSCRAGRC